MSTEPVPIDAASDLHGAPYTGSHELQRCETCSVSVLRPDPDDITAMRLGEEPETFSNQGRSCQCVGGHQLHRCDTCIRLKVIRADASEQDPRAHKIPLDGYACVVVAVAFALLALRLSGMPAWAWSAVLWTAVIAAAAGVVHIERRRRQARALRDGRDWDR